MSDCKLNARYLLSIFYNETNHYRVAKFKLLETNGTIITVTGIMPQISTEHTYELYGNYVEHHRFGMQFALSHYAIVVPTEEEALIRYFSSSLFPGIGKKSAQLLVEHLGVDAIEKIKKDALILDTLPKNLRKHRYVILNGIKEQDEYISGSFFLSHGFQANQVSKIEAKYGEDAIAVVKENPYRLVYEIDGIGFAMADRFASTLQFDLNSMKRFEAMCYTMVLELCMKSGDSYILDEELETYWQRKNLIDFNLSDCIASLCEQGWIVKEDNRIYHHTQFKSEELIADALKLRAAFSVKEQSIDMKHAIQTVEKQLAFTYDEIQKEAIEQFMSEPFFILTGGPGTGKTTIVNGALRVYQQFYPEARIVLCAPTGRAAKRLSELSECSAMTIHRLLKWNMDANVFEVNSEHPIDADVLVVDEASMVDQWLFSNLLQACGDVKKIVLIGDENQLESVGCGCVLRDLLQSKQFPSIHLQRIYRQSEGSEVVALAHHVLEEADDCLYSGEDVAFFHCGNVEMKEQVMQVVSHALSKGYELSDIQVIAPMYQGVAGIDALNHALQKLCNPPDPLKHELTVGYRTFREGDRILQLKNQVEENVYNGDIGTIVEIEYATDNALHQNVIVADFDGILVEYTNEQFVNITHAFCISIHKAQGSEYPIVVLPILYDYRYMLSKRLIYTAITRAKRSLVILGEEAAFYYAMKRNDVHERRTTLLKRLNKKQTVSSSIIDLKIVE